MNPMRQIRLEKVTLNVGAGKDQAQLEKGIRLLKNITGIDPVKTKTKRRIPEWGLRPGLPIGCKITLRKGAAAELLKRLMASKENTLLRRQFDSSGNVSFGIPEYIDIADAKYDPKVGVMGLEVAVTLERPGFRVKRRKNGSRVGKRHQITQGDAIEFMKKEFSLKLKEEEE